VLKFSTYAILSAVPSLSSSEMKPFKVRRLFPCIVSNFSSLRLRSMCLTNVRMGVNKKAKLDGISRIDPIHLIFPLVLKNGYTKHLLFSTVVSSPIPGASSSSTLSPSMDSINIDMKRPLRREVVQRIAQALESQNNIIDPKKRKQYELEKQLEKEKMEEKDPFIRQKHLEEKAVSNAAQRYVSQLESMRRLKKAACLKPAEKILLSWFGPLRSRIEKEQEKIKSGICSSPGCDAWGAYFIQLPPEKMAVITMHTILGLILPVAKGISFTSAY